MCYIELIFVLIKLLNKLISKKTIFENHPKFRPSGNKATLTCSAVHILCMAILGGWVPD
jgi:hypothetical protein